MCACVCVKNYCIDSICYISEVQKEDLKMFTRCQKSFYVGHIQKTFFQNNFLNGPDKLLCLSLSIVYGLMFYRQVRLERTQVEHLSGNFLYGWLLAVPSNITPDWYRPVRDIHSSLFGI